MILTVGKAEFDNRWIFQCSATLVHALYKVNNAAIYSTILGSLPDNDGSSAGAPVICESEQLLHYCL